MGSLALLQSLKESVLGQADVKAIYGAPITAHDKTIVPVAKVMFAYGAGAGTGGMGNNNPKGEGGGGGGVVLDCTPKMRHELKGPITLNGGEQCLCPDNSIPVN